MDSSTGQYRNETPDEYHERTGKILGELPHEAKLRKQKKARNGQRVTCYPCTTNTQVSQDTSFAEMLAKQAVVVPEPIEVAADFSEPVREIVSEPIKVTQLEDVLEKLKLLDFQDQLQSMGVEVAEDLEFVEETDVLNMGMTKIQMRKLMRYTKSIK